MAGPEGGSRRVRMSSRLAAGPRTATSALPWPQVTVTPDGVRVTSHSPVPDSPGSVAWKMQALAVSAQVRGLCAGRADGDAGEPFVDAVRGKFWGQIDV